MKRTLPLALIASLLASGCTVGPNYHAPAASGIGVPPGYAASHSVATPVELERWWAQLGDAELDRLVSRALAGNLDLAVARSRLIQAREGIVQARAAGLPSLSAGATATRNVQTGTQSTTTFSLAGDASWEADLFGGVRRSVEASRAAAEASAYDLASARVSLVADVATYYVQARLAQQRLALARQNLGYADDNLQIARWRLQAGLASSLDVEQARGARAQVAATLPSYQQSLSQAVFRLGVLTGQAPEALTTELAQAGPLPRPTTTLAAGLPADTLRQRPDVRAAERNLAAETARIGVAQAQLYPALRIGGNIGTSALSLGGLADLITGSLFATLSQTIFDGGKTRSQVRAQTAAAQGAFATYRQTVLVALEDVEKALVAVTTAVQRKQAFAEAQDAAHNQAILARSNYRAGLSDFQTLLEAERSLISANDGELTSEADRVLAIVQLYRALGGGWDQTNPAQD